MAYFQFGYFSFDITQHVRITDTTTKSGVGRWGQRHLVLNKIREKSMQYSRKIQVWGSGRHTFKNREAT